MFVGYVAKCRQIFASNKGKKFSSQLENCGRNAYDFLHFFNPTTAFMEIL